MAYKSYSAWNYFSGSNAVVKMDEIIIGESVSIEYSTMQNRTPLYGYNAPLFNAVADGQFIAKGTLAINYISHEYLYAIIKSRIDNSLSSLFKITEFDNSITQENIIDPDTGDILITENMNKPNGSSLTNSTLNDIIINGSDSQKIKALKAKFWNKNTNEVNDYNFDLQNSNILGRPDQNSRSINITVTFGDEFKSESATKHILKDVFFLGRSMSTAITEDPNVEVFQFFSRNLI